MTYVLANEEAKCFWALANRPIASIENDLKNNLLVFPSSFQECKDKIGEQHLFDIYPENQKFSSLKTSNLVGFIGINGLHISIHSRFSKNTEKDFCKETSDKENREEYERKIISKTCGIYISFQVVNPISHIKTIETGRNESGKNDLIPNGS